MGPWLISYLVDMCRGRSWREGAGSTVRRRRADSSCRVSRLQSSFLNLNYVRTDKNRTGLAIAKKINFLSQTACLLAKD